MLPSYGSSSGKCEIGVQMQRGYCCTNCLGLSFLSFTILSPLSFKHIATRCVAVQDGAWIGVNIMFAPGDLLGGLDG